MNKTITAGIVALTAMFAGSTMAAEKFSDGAHVMVSKFNTITNKDVGFILRKKGEDEQGDGIYHLECTGEGGGGNKGEYLTTSGESKPGSFVGYDKDTTEWVLHKNSSGWSIILRKNGALAVSKNGERKELQRNQGAKHQVWQISEK